MDFAKIAFVSGLFLSLGLSGYASGQAVSIDFERDAADNPTSAGQLLIGLPRIGATFINPLEVILCDPSPTIRNAASSCGRARSVDKAVRSSLSSEFRRAPIVFRFADAKEAVTVHVRLDAGSERNGEQVTIVMEAFDATDRRVASESTTFIHNMVVDSRGVITADADWEPLSVEDTTSGSIRRVEIWGGESSTLGFPLREERASNFFLLDDLSMVGESSVLDPSDDVPPSAFLVAPATGTEFGLSERFIEVQTRAWDDSGVLDWVRLQVQRAGTVEVVTICGRSPEPVCGMATTTDPLDRVITHELQQPGDYDLAIIARDLAGNETLSNSVSVRVTDSPRPVVVRALKVEVNQGVQNDRGLFDVDGPGTIRGTGLGFNFPPPWGTLVAGRKTVIRYYLAAEGTDVAAFSAALQVGVWRDGSSRTSHNVVPNTDVGTVDVPAIPVGAAARNDLVWQMRADKDQTLNFVIPSNLMAEAVTLDLELEGVTGVLQLPVAPEASLGLFTIHLIGDQLTAPTVPNTNAIIEYLMAAFPISDLRFPVFAEDRWSNSPGTTVTTGTFLEYYSRLGSFNGTPDCKAILAYVAATFGDDDLPLLDRPDFVATVAIAGGGLMGCLGLASPDGIAAISDDDPASASHEIGHLMGFVHASNDHEEAERGGTAFEPWPYPHGTISPDGRGVFGTIANEVSGVGLGTWELTLVAPCLVDRTDAKSTDLGCVGDDLTKMHEMMSYGHVLPWTGGFLGGTHNFLWPSDITYQRIYRRLRSGVVDPPSGTLLRASVFPFFGQSTGTASRVESLWIFGEVDRTGRGRLLQPPLRKLVPKSALTESGEGNYTLRLVDDEGTLLSQRTFALEYADRDFRYFQLAVPYVDDARALSIHRAGEPVLTLAASAGRPEVLVVSPNGREVFQSGELVVRWEAGDPDNDPLSFLVQYSPDGGRRWQGIAIVEDPVRETAIRVDELFRGKRGVIRVSTSDGFNTAVDESDGAFAVGLDENSPVTRWLLWIVAAVLFFLAVLILWARAKANSTS